MKENLSIEQQFNLIAAEYDQFDELLNAIKKSL